jgi:hypothetical protein
MSVRARALASAMALVSVVSVSPVRGDPGDIFTMAAPAVGSAQPAAADLHAGDTSVSATGAFQYGYPIRLPPGRNGVQPSVSLTYSSQAGIYGSIASGWTLAGVPIITLDTSGGILAYAGSPGEEKIYKSSMAGDRPLIP